MAKKIMVFTVLVALFQAQMAFADADKDFRKALSKNDLAKAEKILRSKASKIRLTRFLDFIIRDTISGFNSENSLRVAQMLIKFGADVNADYYYLDAPLLYIAVRHCPLDKDKKLAMINLLCKAGANPNAYSETSTALMAAANFKPEYRIAYTRALVENGADLNLKNNNGYTALFYNIDDFDTFAYLVEKGADVNTRSKKGETALIYAAAQEKPDIVKYLVEHGANVNLRDNEGLTAASICYDKGQIDLYNYLKANGAIDFEPKVVQQQAPAPAPVTTNNYYSEPAREQSSTSSPTLTKQNCRSPLRFIISRTVTGTSKRLLFL
jgi:ankyrin repeat protein